MWIWVSEIYEIDGFSSNEDTPCIEIRMFNRN